MSPIFLSRGHVALPHLQTGSTTARSRNMTMLKSTAVALAMLASVSAFAPSTRRPSEFSPRHNCRVAQSPAHLLLGPSCLPATRARCRCQCTCDARASPRVAPHDRDKRHEHRHHPAVAATFARPQLSISDPPHGCPYHHHRISSLDRWQRPLRERAARHTVSMAVDRNPNFAKLQAGYAPNPAVVAPTLAAITAAATRLPPTTSPHVSP